MLNTELMINQHFNSRIFVMTTYEDQLKLLLTSERLFTLQNRAKQRVFILFPNASTLAQKIKNV